MALTEQQRKDIEGEDKVEGPGWIFMVSASDDLHTVVGVASRRLDGSERPLEEAKIIARDKAEQQYRQSFPDDPLPTLKLLEPRPAPEKK